MAESAAYHPRSATEIQREADRKEAERVAELIQFECRMQTKYKADFGRSYLDCLVAIDGRSDDRAGSAWAAS